MPPPCSGLQSHDAAGKWISKWLGVLQIFPDKFEATSQHVLEKFKKYVGRSSFVKSDLADTAATAWRHVTRQHLLISQLLEENRQLSQRVMDRDSRVITLQEELLECKNAQLESVTTTVQSAVKQSVEKSWSQIASSVPLSQPVQPVISHTAIQRAVKDMAEGEVRSKNVVVFGLEEEEDEEDVGSRVTELLDVLGEKPRLETVKRMGRKTTGHHRPVLVELRSSVAAAGVLKKSQALRNSDKFKRVFISPDRTLAQRVEQRELVCSMKKQTAEDKSRRFFIRDYRIESVQRDQAGRGSSTSSDSSGSSESDEEETDIEIFE